MRFGTERISSSQRNLLARASRSQGITESAEAFYRVVNDQDILEDREDLHPDWVQLFASRRDVLRDIMGPRVFKQVEDLFAQWPGIDSELLELTPSKASIAFLLGAGASRPEPSNIPVTAGLLAHLLNRARRLNREEFTRVSDFCERNNITNIEDLLTAAQVASYVSKNPNLLRLLDFLLYGDVREEMTSRSRRLPEVSSVALVQDALQLLFGLLSGVMIPAEPNKAHLAVAEFAKNHPATRIITTNYDCCIDQALGEPGKEFFYQVVFGNNSEGKCGDNALTRLIKLHGSLNWFYCDTCQSVQLSNIKRIVADFKKDSATYPVVGVCPACSGQRRGLAVPPLAMKFDFYPPLTPLLSEAEDAFAQSDVIVGIGFSFAEADLYIARMISKSLQKRPAQRVVIVDPNPEVSMRVRRRFSNNIVDFNPKRVLGLSYDCCEVLPSFLGDNLKEFVEAKRQLIARPKTNESERAREAK